MAKHRKPTRRWPRLAAIVASSTALGATLVSLIALQPAAALQDAFTPADPNLSTPSAVCNTLECVWDFASTPDAYTFALQRDGLPRPSAVELEVQSPASTLGPAQNWRALLNDPNRIAIIDFFNVTPRVWVGGEIALQADPYSLGVVTQSTNQTHDLHPGPVDASVTGATVRIHQIFAPTVEQAFVLPMTEGDLATFGPDASAIARVTFSEPVTDVQATDFAPTLMSTGCRVSDLSDSGDGRTFDMVLRGCVGPWVNILVRSNSVIGNIAGPIADYYTSPIQPYVSAATASSATPTATPTPTPTSTPTSSATPAPTPVPTPTSTANAQSSAQPNAAPVMPSAAPSPSDPPPPAPGASVEQTAAVEPVEVPQPIRVSQSTKSAKPTEMTLPQAVAQPKAQALVTPVGVANLPAKVTASSRSGMGPRVNSPSGANTGANATTYSQGHMWLIAFTSSVATALGGAGIKRLRHNIKRSGRRAPASAPRKLAPS